MASSTTNHIIFVLITFLTILKTSLSFQNKSSVNGDYLFALKHVVITNKMATHAGLVFHCSNKEKDLGFKAILFEESFDFKFRVNLRSTTTYTCTFSWPENVMKFDIFRADRDDSTSSQYRICSECIWYIYESGPCRIRRDGGSPYCFPWIL
ncbi:unnamed protein product [Cochlearia groenlandica]